MRRAWLAAICCLAAGAAEPPRVASFSPAATRIMIDLGAAEHICAATRWCGLPDGHAARRDCDAFEPDLESLRSSRATHAILPRLANPMLAERVRSLGIEVVVLAPEAPDSPAADITTLAEALGLREKGRRLIARRTETVRQPCGKRVLIIWDGVCAGPKSYLSWVIRHAGGDVAIDAGAWPAWDIEMASRSRPDIVLRLGNEGPVRPEIDSVALRQWRATPGLRSTPAGENGRIYRAKAGSDWLPASGLPEAAATLSELIQK